MDEEKRKKLIKWLTVDNDLQIKTCMEVENPTREIKKREREKTVDLFF
tara:strand:- start:130 stop:273 length:144 start_codon:yes stop_codon:yes gene_type:complete